MDDDLTQDDVALVDPPEEETEPQGDPVQAEAETPEADATQEGEELVITLGDEPPPEEEKGGAEPWVKDLRKQQREMARALREKDNEIARLKGATAQPPALVLGPKPTFEACEYDEEKFATALDSWHVKKREFDEQQATKQRAAEAENARWTSRIDAVNKAAKAMPVRDYEEAEAAFDDAFSIVQRGIIYDGPDDAKECAQLRYALGKNPKLAKELASIQNPVKFTFAIGNLMSKLKVTTRRAAPLPDTPVRSSVGNAATTDNQLEKLREEAQKTGDVSKLLAYKRAKRAA